MTGDKVQILLAMIAYMFVVIGIGVYFMKRSQKNPENYFLGGRSLGPWVAAMSAEASDMSGWLLMGLPGVAYWCGIADAAWTAIGLAIGTYLNWLLVSKRLRNYSVVAGNSITLPDFFSNRFKEKKKVILGIASLFILVFFAVYASSCFVTCGKLFAGIFELDYHLMLIIGAVFVLLYTLIGGFLAESASDFMQSIVMIVALVSVVVFGVANAGGIDKVVDNAKNIPGYYDFFHMANPENQAGVSISSLIADENGEYTAYFNETATEEQKVIIHNIADVEATEATEKALEEDSTIDTKKTYDDAYASAYESALTRQGYEDYPLEVNPASSDVSVLKKSNSLFSNEKRDYGFLTILSMLAWGLGYFGMPQVLLRFMAIRKTKELKRSRRIATVWVVISLGVAVFIGVVGRAVLPYSDALNSASAAENVFAELGALLFHPVVAGVIMAGILAATISSSDSYLLIAGSAVSQGLYKGIFKKNASDKQVMWMSRIVILIIAIVGVIIAWDDQSVIFKIVSFAWAGFGATFGPLMLFSLFWKRTTRLGAIAGMLSGAFMVFFWKFVLNPFGGVWAIYELLPAFIISCIFIVVVSLVSKEPSDEIKEEFDKAKTYVEA